MGQMPVDEWNEALRMAQAQAVRIAQAQAVQNVQRAQMQANAYSFPMGDPGGGPGKVPAGLLGGLAAPPTISPGGLMPRIEEPARNAPERVLVRKDYLETLEARLSDLEARLWDD